MCQKGHPVDNVQNLRSCSKTIWWLNLYFSRRDCLYFDFLTCSLYFSSIVADLDLWWLNTLYPKVQISMKTSSKALTIQTKQDKQSYLMFCPCGKCLLEAILFIGPCIALIKGENRNGKIFFICIFICICTCIYVCRLKSRERRSWRAFFDQQSI